MWFLAPGKFGSSHTQKAPALIFLALDKLEYGRRPLVKSGAYVAAFSPEGCMCNLFNGMEAWIKPFAASLPQMA